MEVARSVHLAALVARVSPSASCYQTLNNVTAYGQCGVGAYCLGGCDPANSYELESCVPAPVCRSQKYYFQDLSGIASVDNYLGDASQNGWVSTGNVLHDSSRLPVLTMSNGSAGSMISSSAYVWYGKVSVSLSTSAGVGVVTDILLYADSKDEIAFEFLGADLTAAQTNYWFQGIDSEFWLLRSGLTPTT